MAKSGRCCELPLLPISSIAVPALSRLLPKPEEYRRFYLRYVGYVMSLTMPGAACMIACADSIVLEPKRG